MAGLESCIVQMIIIGSMPSIHDILTEVPWQAVAPKDLAIANRCQGNLKIGLVMGKCGQMSLHVYCLVSIL